ncbi:alpha/beta fold hydrolase [Methylobacterium sp. C25]|nr:alpha/beta fold hydrolase [Methylobacterium sp. C25]MCE4223925.1 alpha/beta fold hydrolase [Methylobacterium sp. C25]
MIGQCGVAPPRDGVVLLHGTARRASSMRSLERAFAAAGYATLNIDYPARQAALGTIAGIIRSDIATFSARVAQVHFVTHSMGGLVARALITRHRPAKLGRVVMLGPPNGGSEVADALRHSRLYRRFFGPAGAQLATQRSETLTRLVGPVDYPLGIIAADRSLYPLESWLLLPGPNDGRVTVARTRVDGMSAHLTLHTTHITMMWNHRVIREALHFVREGRFASDRAFSREEAAPR